MGRKLRTSILFFLSLILLFSYPGFPVYADGNEMPMSEIDLTELKNTDVEIIRKEVCSKNIKGVDISQDGEILVTLKENVINFYNSDAEFQFCIKAAYSGTTIGFWYDDEIIIRFNRGDFALGLNKEGTVVSAYKIDNNTESSKAYRELISQRKITSGDYIYFFNSRTQLYRTNLQEGDKEIVYKNNFAVKKTILHIFLVLLFFAIVVFAIIVRIILPIKNNQKRRLY